MRLLRASGSKDKNIVCRYCAHGKVWHRNEAECHVEDCDCDAWDYGVNVVEVPR